MIPTTARLQLEVLESFLHTSLDSTPIDQRDQWTTALREEMRRLGADVTDPDQATQVFVGAYVMAQSMLAEPVTPTQAVRAVFMLRNLYDRATDETVSPPAANFSPWTRLLVWLVNRLAS